MNRVIFGPRKAQAVDRNLIGILGGVFGILCMLDRMG